MEHRAIKHLIDVLGDKPKEFTATANVSYGLIRKWLDGTKKIQPKHAFDISRRLGVSAECLIANQVGPCFMEDGQVATLELINEWQHQNPSNEAVQILADRAGTLIKHLVLIAANKNRYAYREVLESLSDFILKHGKAEELSSEERLKANCTIDKIETDHADVWWLIHEDHRFKTFCTGRSKHTMVCITWRSVEMMHPLTTQSDITGGIPGDLRNDVQGYRKHTIVVASSEASVEVERVHWHLAPPSHPKRQKADARSL